MSYFIHSIPATLVDKIFYFINNVNNEQPVLKADAFYQLAKLCVEEVHNLLKDCRTDAFSNLNRLFVLSNNKVLAVSPHDGTTAFIVTLEGEERDVWKLIERCLIEFANSNLDYQNQKDKLIKYLVENSKV